MPKRFHPNWPDRAKEVIVALAGLLAWVVLIS